MVTPNSSDLLSKERTGVLVPRVERCGNIYVYPTVRPSLTVR